MAVGIHKMMLPHADGSFTPTVCVPCGIKTQLSPGVSCRTPKFQVSALASGNGNGMNNKGPPNSNYVVPLDKTSCLIRPLSEIFRDFNKRIPDDIIKSQDFNDNSTVIPWYQGNRMLSFYASGWCREIRDVIFFENSSVAVVYRITIRV